MGKLHVFIPLTKNGASHNALAMTRGVRMGRLPKISLPRFAIPRLGKIPDLRSIRTSLISSFSAEAGSQSKLSEVIDGFGKKIPIKNMRPLAPRIWGGLNGVSNLVDDIMPNNWRVTLDKILNNFPFGMVRNPDSGDFSKTPALVDLRLITNLIKRYVGSAESRATAWEDFALYLDRWGWRISKYIYEQAHSVKSTAGIAAPKRTDMDLIFASEHFKVMVPRGLLIDRRDGGHLAIFPKVETPNRWDFTPPQAIEYICISMAVGKAMIEVMNESGINVERLNFMDMGNWRLLTPKAPRFHEHIFGRARGSRFQIHGEFNKLPPKGSPHYDMINPMNEKEIARLKERIPVYFREFIEGVEYWIASHSSSPDNW